MEGPRRPHTQPFKITICKLLLLYLIKNKTCWPPRPCLTRRDKGGVKALLPCCPQGLCWNRSIAGSQPSKVDISSPRPFRWALQRWACLVWAVKWVVTVELRPGNSSLAQPGSCSFVQLLRNRVVSWPWSVILLITRPVTANTHTLAMQSQ